MRFMPTLDRSPASGDYRIVVDPATEGDAGAFSREVARILQRALALYRPALRFAGDAEGLGLETVGDCPHVIVPDVARASVECLRRHSGDDRFIFFPTPLDFDATYFGLVRNVADHLRVSGRVEADAAELDRYLAQIGALGRQELPDWLQRTGLVELVRRAGLIRMAKALFFRAASKGWRLPGSGSAPDGTRAGAESYRYVLDHLGDEESRDILRRVVEGRIRETISISLQSCFRVHQYMDTVRLEPGDVIISGGVFRGEEIPGFLFMTSGNCRMYCFDPAGRTDLAPHVRRWVDAFPECVEFVESALGERTGAVHLSRRADGQFEESGDTGSVPTQSFAATSIDDFVRSRGLASVDLLKLDIEGGEEAALRGALWTLATHRPQLAISIYHRRTSYVEIPAALMRHCERYDWRIRHYSFSGREVVLYGFPQEGGRVAARASA
jgi:FkbM family methyltransferase